MAEKMGTNGKLILAFVTLLLGIVLITVIATQTNTVTSAVYVPNESMNIASARLVGNQINNSKQFNVSNPGLQDAGGIVTNSIVIINASGANLAGNFTVNYNVYPELINFTNSTYMISGGGLNNQTYVSYSYYPSSYMTNTFGNTVITLIPGFFAIALLMISLGLFYSVAKDAGII